MVGNGAVKLFVLVCCLVHSAASTGAIFVELDIEGPKQETAGLVVMEVRPEWAPKGAKRFIELVESGHFDGYKFFRVIANFVAQTGLPAVPSDRWSSKTIKDDPVVVSNKRGYVSFASGGKDTRDQQIFFNIKDNVYLDSSAFAPFAKVSLGMDVVDSIHVTGGGPSGPKQSKIEKEGNTYLDANFPSLSFIRTARVKNGTMLPSADMDSGTANKIVLFASVMLCFSALFCFARHCVVSGSWGSGNDSISNTLDISAFAVSWYAISVTFGLFNKFVFNQEKYAFPLLISSSHMLFKGTFVSVFMLCSRFFGSLTSSPKLQIPTCKEFFLYFVPIGCLTGGDIGLTNIAIQIGQISLVTVIKNGGIVLTLVIGIFLGLQPCSRRLLSYTLMICIGAALALWNEPDFNPLCAFAAFGACVCGSIRWSLTQKVLQQTPFSTLNVILFISPSATLSALAAGYYMEGDRFSRALNKYGNEGPYLQSFVLLGFAGGAFALGMLIIEFRLIQKTSALTVDVLAKLKDVILISMAIALYHEQLSSTNMVGVAIMFIGMLLFSKLKAKAHRKERNYTRVPGEEHGILQAGSNSVNSENFDSTEDTNRSTDGADVNDSKDYKKEISRIELVPI